MERKCEDEAPAKAPPASGDVSHTAFSFDTDLKDFQKFYFEKADVSPADDETVIVRPAEVQSNGRLKIQNHLWVSKNHV